MTNRFVSFERKKNQNKAKQFFSEFLKLRQSPRNDMYFMLRSPIRIIKIHTKSIIFKKLIKRSTRIKDQPKAVEPIISERTFPLRI